MRFDRFEIDAFGQLKGFRADGLSSHPLLVVHGDNESGKTTLREFLATVLYGFSPAQAGHPYAPWSGGAPGGRVGLRLQDGRDLSLERRLRERAEGHLSTDGAAPVELGNRPLPSTGPVDRAIFDDVHAPRRDAPDGLSESTWALVRERLLGGAPVEGMRTAREAAADIEARANQLWQPSRRAHTRHRLLSLRIRRLQKDRDRAAAEMARMLELRGLISSRTWHGKGMEEQLNETRARLLRAERLLPVVRGQQRAEELRRRAAEALPKDDFPHNARAKHAELRSAAQVATEQGSALSAEVAAHEQRAVLSLQDQALLAAEDEIRTIVGEAAVHQQDMVHVNDLTRERDAQEAVFRERGQHVFSVVLDATRREVLARLGMAELRSRITAWEDAANGPELAAEELRQAKEYVRTCELDYEAVPSSDIERKQRNREELLRQLQAREDAWQALKKDSEVAKAQRDTATKRMRRPRERTTQAAGLFLAGACTLLTLFFGAKPAWWFIVPAAAAMFWFGWKCLRSGSESAPLQSDEARAEAARQECLKLRQELQLHEFEPVAVHLEKAQQGLAHVASRPELERRLVLARQRADDAARRVAERGSESDKVRTRVEEFLAELPIIPARLEHPGQDLLHDLDELRDALRTMTRCMGEQQAVAQRARERDARAARLAERLESALHRSPMEAATLWHERLQLALGAKRRADESARALPVLRDKGRELESLVRLAAGGLRAFEERLAALDPNGRVEDGLHLLEQARAWRAEADETEAALRRQFPDWQERAAEAQDALRTGEQLDLSTEQRVALTEQISQLDSGLTKLREEIDLLARERDELMRRRPLADVDGALAALHEQRCEIEQQRDRLMAQAALLRLADERWRVRWQAPVVTAASAHLSVLTSGRWERMSVEIVDGRTHLYMKRFDSESLHEVIEPMSRAARAQAWLALRLALADQLDGDEPLPLVLDDPFGDWDAARIKQAAALLAATSVRRQIIVLTGQSSVAEQFETQVKACVLRLPAPPSISGDAEATPAPIVVMAPPPPARPRRRSESRKERNEARKAELAKSTPPSMDAPRTDAPVIEMPKVDQPKAETPSMDMPKAEMPKVEMPRVETPMAEQPRVAMPDMDSPRPYPPRVETPKLELPPIELTKPEMPQVEAPRSEPMAAPRAEVSRPEPMRMEPPRVEAPSFAPSPSAPVRMEIRYEEPAKIESPRAEIRAESPAKIEPIRSSEPPRSEPPKVVVDMDDPAKAVPQSGGPPAMVIRLDDLPKPMPPAAEPPHVELPAVPVKVEAGVSGPASNGKLPGAPDDEGRPPMNV